MKNTLSNFIPKNNNILQYRQFYKIRQFDALKKLDKIGKFSKYAIPKVKFSETKIKYINYKNKIKIKNLNPKKFIINKRYYNSLQPDNSSNLIIVCVCIFIMTLLLMMSCDKKYPITKFLYVLSLSLLCLALIMQ